ncbi:MAG: hypothetical protein HY986_21340 [Candidatus Melainabacteria bacterium]|nr:hypothetical protein [Candidatus Melainabacteria bacterium]
MRSNCFHVWCGLAACAMLFALSFCPVLLPVAPAFAQPGATVTLKSVPAKDGSKSETVTLHDKKTGPIDNGSGIFYGEGHSYALSAPSGWVLDTQAGRSQGLVAVFYPRGSSWSDSPVVMYSRIVKRDGRSLEKVIRADIDYMKEASPEIKESKQEPIPYGNPSKPAQLRYLSADKNGNVEAVAYMEEPDWVVFCVLSARNQEQFEKAVPALKELVSSYHYLTNQVQIQK